MAEPLGYGDFLSDIEARFGLNFTVEDTGGGCLLMQARLEDGSWIVISDWDAGLNPLRRRRELEGEGTTIGWNVSIYADDGDSWPDHSTWLASVRHETNAVDELTVLIEMALAALRESAHHDYHRGGRYTIARGVCRSRARPDPLVVAVHADSPAGGERLPVGDCPHLGVLGHVRVRVQRGLHIKMS